MAGSTKHKGFKNLYGDESNPTFGIAVGETSRALHILTADDYGTDWNVAADTHPTVYIHSATTPATDYVKIYHDATIAYLDVVGGTTLQLLIAGTAEIDLTASALSPAVTDSNALGTTALMWSDLFLASGAVVNFNNGDVTITHSLNNIAVAGGTTTLAGLVMTDATNIVLNATTGTKIGTAITEKLGFYNATPIVQPSAYTQTYATADKTHAAMTSSDMPAGGTGAAAGGWDTAANRDIAIADFAELRVDVIDLKQLVNSVIDDLQALGLAA